MKMHHEKKKLNMWKNKSAARCVLYRTAAVVPTSSMVVRVTMDFFQHRYYRLNKILMSLIGQWPYQSTVAKRGFLVVLIVIMISATVTVGPAIVKYRDDGKMFMECFMRYVFALASIVKLLSFIVHSQKRLNLLNSTRMDWQVWARDREVNVLHRYAEQGEKMASLYADLPMLRAAIAYVLLFGNLLQPLVPLIIDALLRNDTVSREFPYPVVFYNMDEQKYYFYLILHANVCAGLLATIIISNDVLLIIYVHHVCGIFSALGHKLKRIGNDVASVEITENPNTLHQKNMGHLASCIDRHIGAIEYVNLIEASYTRTFFITAWLGMILINAVGLQVLKLSNNPVAILRFIGSVLGILFYFFMECHLSQMLIDHSSGIRYCIYSSQWYRLPPKTQKLLQFMTMRSAVPCQLTAGKMMFLSVRSFWLGLKTTISYFGFLRSTQGL